jgi:hypothetical protein
MDNADILRYRLHNQRLSTPSTETPADVVRWHGAMQSQEFGPAKWSIGQRIVGTTEPDIARAFDAGEILRTHALRPTWHFVAAEDIRWILELTAPRVYQLNATMYRRLELDDAVLARAHAALADSLQRGRHRTRTDLADYLKCAGIEAEGMRLGYIMMHAELDGWICSGAMRGKQQTYALLSERAPQAKSLARDEALAELVRRFFTGHGPATVKDFARWSGLTIADTKRGLEMLGQKLVSATIDGRTYWFAELPAEIAIEPSPTAHLLQGYDEYTIGYGESRDLCNPYFERFINRDSYLHSVIIDGKVAAAWKRTLKRTELQIEIAPYRDLSTAELAAIQDAAAAHGRFMDLPVLVSFT